MLSILTNARVLVGREIVDDHVVVVDGATIKGVVRAADAPRGEARDLGGALLLPGFLDIQVNGGNGRLFNDSPDVETIRHIGAAHRRYGTTGFLPTLISDELDVIEAAIGAVGAAIEESVPGVLGIHIEGPFLSTDKKGVHDPARFRRLKPELVRLLTSLKRGKTLVTLAPENASPDLVRDLVRAGVVVSAGHTDASYSVMRACLDAGVTGFTHLFNAMSHMSSREPGVVGAALEDQKSWCGLIVDGKHVAPALLKIALRCKPIDKFMLVTDAMPTVGMEHKEFRLQGRVITVEDGVCVAEGGTIAGSDLAMSTAVKNAIDMLGVEIIDAAKMASLNPARFLGLESSLGEIAPGRRASLVALDDAFNVVETWIDGVASGPAVEIRAALGSPR
jgi:N-acetylglucosamine-6-phosphate deacetylase